MLGTQFLTIGTSENSISGIRQRLTAAIHTTIMKPKSAGVMGPIGVMPPIGVLTGMITETVAAGTAAGTMPPAGSMPPVGTMPPVGNNQ